MHICLRSKKWPRRKQPDMEIGTHTRTPTKLKANKYFDLKSTCAAISVHKKMDVANTCMVKLRAAASWWLFPCKSNDGA